LIGIFAFYPRDIMQAWVLAMALCPCLPQVGVLSKWMDRIIWLLAWGLLSTSPTPCFKEIQVSTKTTVLPSGTFFQTPHTENFAPGISIIKRAISMAQERWTLTT